jgi:hypothetical protein
MYDLVPECFLLQRVAALVLSFDEGFLGVEVQMSSSEEPIRLCPASISLSSSSVGTSNSIMDHLAFGSKPNSRMISCRRWSLAYLAFFLASSSMNFFLVLRISSVLWWALEIGSSPRSFMKDLASLSYGCYPGAVNLSLSSISFFCSYSSRKNISAS